MPTLTQAGPLSNFWDNCSHFIKFGTNVIPFVRQAIVLQERITFVFNSWRSIFEKKMSEYYVTLHTSRKESAYICTYFLPLFRPLKYSVKFSQHLAVAPASDSIEFSPHRHILLFSDLPSIPSPTDIPTDNLCPYYISPMHAKCLVQLIPFLFSLMAHG
jgi:hypothetical protein